MTKFSAEDTKNRKWAIVDSGSRKLVCQIDRIQSVVVNSGWDDSDIKLQSIVSTDKDDYLCFLKPIFVYNAFEFYIAPHVLPMSGLETTLEPIILPPDCEEEPIDQMPVMAQNIRLVSAMGRGGRIIRQAVAKYIKAAPSQKTPLEKMHVPLEKMPVPKQKANKKNKVEPKKKSVKSRELSAGVLLSPKLCATVYAYSLNGFNPMLIDHGEIIEVLGKPHRAKVTSKSSRAQEVNIRFKSNVKNASWSRKMVVALSELTRYSEYK